MNTTLAVVVSAIVILIAALVVITIFGGGMGQVGTLTNADSICRTQAASSCRSTGQMPLTWDIPSVSRPKSGGGTETVPCGLNGLGLAKDCSQYGGTSTPTGGGVDLSTCSGQGGTPCNPPKTCTAPTFSAKETQYCCKGTCT
ncbi:MAG: hypothetical protein FJY76_01695 [Candidatus Aenigmarchaeota archaeon]|nr:hypothetical protein [Candidatus Aenigmarchaeota archaeon]